MSVNAEDLIKLGIEGLRDQIESDIDKAIENCGTAYATIETLHNMITKSAVVYNSGDYDCVSNITNFLTHKLAMRKLTDILDAEKPESTK